jgi:hypothetical protein
MRAFPILFVVLLAGCSATPEQVAQALPQMSNMEICKGVMIASGQKAAMAQGEASRRGLNCAQYFGAIQQQDANQNAAINNYLQSINPPQTLRPTMNCRSYRVGSDVRTDCN